MKSAVDARQRPTAALLEEGDPFTNWNSYDYRIQEAINIMDREVCKSCGNPIWLCHSTDNRIQFEVRTGLCAAKAEIEDKEKASETSGSKLNSGEYYYAVPTGVKYKDENNVEQEDPLPSRLEALQKMG